MNEVPTASETACGQLTDVRGPVRSRRAWMSPAMPAGDTSCAGGAGVAVGLGVGLGLVVGVGEDVGLALGVAGAATDGVDDVESLPARS
ncbi:hypothetical protein GCM10009821_03740 [Aeromicrobium halocynthiae]|uniref:Uncharacterized protein n=1 Tax=Aeromicrobium halocynthiae TaxID=560557 RepID=A0ABN2VRL6_9ACTN